MVKREYEKILNECTVMRGTIILSCTCGFVCNHHTQLTAIRLQLYESTNQIGYNSCLI